MMCPDSQILSLYFDDELSSPWKEKFEAHLAGCASCAEKLANYTGLRTELTSFQPPSCDAARNRVWQNLAAIEKPARITLWSARVSVPLPALAAAVLALALSFSIVLLRLSPAAPDTGIIAEAPPASIDFSSPSFTPVSSMSDVLRYLETEDSSGFMVITLPESRSFSRYGEPTILKAADYSRRGNGQ
jgi:anti-sigma factor RsiW